MELITEKEAAQLLKVSQKTVSRLRAAGEIPFIPGRPIRIKLADLLGYIERTVQCRPTSKTQDLLNLLPEDSKSAIQKKREEVIVRESSLAGRLAALRPKRS